MDLDSSLLISILAGFSKVTYPERTLRLKQTQLFSQQDLDILQGEGTFSHEDADLLIENAIGIFSLPLGVALNFVINKKIHIIPLAIEETSVIAAASSTAKWIRDHGELTAENINWLSTGQIQIPNVVDFKVFKEKIIGNKALLLKLINTEIAVNMVNRGGGAKDLTVRKLKRPDGKFMAVIHVSVDPCDAMGANLINQICEFLKPHVEAITGERVGLCILSNLTDDKITRAHVVIHDIDPLVGYAIEEASLFASCDPYRAATHNKGIMNAIDGLLIATGNDWRAVEAGIHAYAARSGQYAPLSQWKMVGNDLHGDFEAPIDVGIVGGVTRIHPAAQVCLRLLRVSSAKELAEIVAAVGLVQNLAALRALTSEGIISGHMRLHATNLLLAQGATKEEIPQLKKLLIQYLATHKKMTSQGARDLIKEFRNK